MRRTIRASTSSRKNLHVGTEWKWHRLYAACPHGQAIPREITDRVAADPGNNTGISGSLYVWEPSMREFIDICESDRQAPGGGIRHGPIRLPGHAVHDDALFRKLEEHRLALYRVQGLSRAKGALRHPLRWIQALVFQAAAGSQTL